MNNKHIVAALLIVFTTYSTNKPPSLPNFGNSCYFNSVFQSFFAIPQFNSFFASGRLLDGNKIQLDKLYLDHLKFPNCFALPYKDLIKDAQKNNAIEKTNLENFYNNSARSFFGGTGAQRDADEYIKKLIDNFSTTSVNQSSQYVKQNTIGQYSDQQTYKVPPSALFSFNTINTITANNSNDDKYIDDKSISEQRTSLILPLLKNELLPKLISKLFDTETVQYTARDNDGKAIYATDKSGNLIPEKRHDGTIIKGQYELKYIQVNKTLTLSSIPPVLQVALNRYDNHRQKIEDPIPAPEQLEMKSFITNSRTPTSYELIAIISHSGNTGGGHYIAYVRDITETKNQDKKWYKCNDSSIDSIKPDNILNVGKDGNFTPYIYFYMRSDYFTEAQSMLAGKSAQTSSTITEFTKNLSKLNTQLYTLGKRLKGL
jgi:ubiquitin C-terminal hydrolase